MNLEVQRIDRVCGREAVLARLRQLLPRMEERSSARVLPFGLAAIDGHLPQGGLALDAVHEFTAGDEGDMPAAFGFMTALLGHAAASPPPGRRPCWSFRAEASTRSAGLMRTG